MYKDAYERERQKKKGERSVEDQEPAFIRNCSHMDVGRELGANRTHREMLQSEKKNMAHLIYKPREVDFQR